MFSILATQNSNLPIYIGIAAGAVILAIIGYVTDKKSKKKQKNNTNQQ